eukprot:jgi/Mesvir1/18045/Mv09362-RA.1
MTHPWTRQPFSSSRLVPVRLLCRLVEAGWSSASSSSASRRSETRRGCCWALSRTTATWSSSGPPERLTLAREIGRGGMGIVRAAILHPFGKEVAVKMLPLPVLSQKASAAFRHEVKVLQRGSTFCHNVCRFLGVTKQHRAGRAAP